METKGTQAMIPLGAYVRAKQPEEYRNWVTVLMQNGYPIPRWGEYGGVTVVKVEPEQEDFTPFQKMIDRVMRWIPRPGRND